MLKLNKTAWSMTAALLMGTWLNSVQAANNNVSPDAGITGNDQVNGHIVVMPGGDAMYVNGSGVAVSGTKSHTSASEFVDTLVNTDKLANPGGRYNGTLNNTGGGGGSGMDSDVSLVNPGNKYSGDAVTNH